MYCGGVPVANLHIESSRSANGNCPNNTNSQQQHTSLGDKVCKLVDSGAVDALGVLLAPLHIITLGTSAGIIAAGHLYCALHGSGN